MITIFFGVHYYISQLETVTYEEYGNMNVLLNISWLLDVNINNIGITDNLILNC